MRKTGKIHLPQQLSHTWPPAPLHLPGQVTGSGLRDNFGCIITAAAVQAEIKDQIKFQAAGTLVQSPAEVKERNFSSP